MTALENVMEAPVNVLKEAKEAAEKNARLLVDKVGIDERADGYIVEEGIPVEMFSNPKNERIQKFLADVAHG